MAEMEILDIDSTTEVLEVQEALRSCLHEETTSELIVAMTRRPFRGTSKAFIKLEESRTDPHQGRVGLLQGTKEDGGQEMLPVMRFRAPGRPMRSH